MNFKPVGIRKNEPFYGLFRLRLCRYGDIWRCHGLRAQRKFSVFSYGPRFRIDSFLRRLPSLVEPTKFHVGTSSVRGFGGSNGLSILPVRRFHAGRVSRRSQRRHVRTVFVETDIFVINPALDDKSPLGTGFVCTLSKLFAFHHMIIYYSLTYTALCAHFSSPGLLIGVRRSFSSK